MDNVAKSRKKRSAEAKEPLLQSIKLQTLKKKSSRQSAAKKQINKAEKARVSGIDIEWSATKGTCTFEGLPVAMMWVDTTLAGVMSAVQAMVGTERFGLALQSEGRKSVEEDWKVISQYKKFRQGLKAIANIAAVAGWGEWKLVSLDEKKKQSRFRAKNTWEGRYQKALGVCWGSGMLAGKLAGYCSKLFGTNCWADQTAFIAKGSAYDEFIVKPSSRSIEQEIENLLASDEATRADMAVALRKLEHEIADRKQVEKSLREKTDELDRYFTLGLDLLCIADTDGYFRRLNPEWERTLGYKLSELEGKRFMDFVHPEDIKTTIAALSQLNRQEEVLNFRNRYRCRDGSYRWIEWRSRPMGELVYAVARDITERIRTEEELHKSEERYRRITGAITDYIYTVRLQDGKETKTTHGPGCIAITGYTEHEFMQDPYLWINIVHPDDRSLVKAQAQQLLAEADSVPIEHRIFRKDGIMRWVRNTPVIQYDENGRLSSYDGLIQDITESKQAATAVSELAKRNQTLMQTATDGIHVLDEHGNVLEANDAFCHMLGYTREEVMQLNVSDWDVQWSHEELMAKISELIRHRKIFITKHRRKDGEVRDMEIHAGGIMLSGRAYLYASARDITDRKRAEEALLEREEKMQSIFRVAPTGIGVVKDRILLDVNPRICEMTGYLKEELVGKSSRIFYPTQEDFEYVGTEKYRQISEKGTGVVETRWMKNDGSILDVLLASTPIDLSDLSKGVTFTALDISERKRAEETIRREKQFTETLLESIPGLFYLYEFDIQSPANSRMIRFNRKHSTLTGYTPEELQGMKIKDWFEPDMLEEAVRAIGIISERGEAQANLQLRMKDGSQVPYAFTGRLLNINDKTYFFGMGFDISDFVRAQEALKESEEKYRLVVENANDAIFIAQDGVIKFPNHRLLNLTGYTEKELTSVPFSCFIHTEDKDMVMERYQKRLRGEDVPSTYSLRIISKAGGTLWVEVNAVLIDWEGRTSVLTFLRDITVQKKLEEQLLHSQKMEAIGTLAGGVAHDFNNLLMGILGYTSLMLMKTDKTHPFYENLKTIERQVESGADLTRQLLGFARGGKYDVRPVNVNDLIIKTSDIFGRTKKEITVHKKLQEDLHTIEADSGQIEQVLLNLYVNAWQAMPAGGELYLESRNVILDEQESRLFNSNPGEYVKISVTDTGVGMDSETQKRIFEPFFSTKSVGKGTGLGLASAYGIIKNHGGLINVYSEKGHGTTFTIYLPASVKEAVETKPAEDSLLSGDETILVVDDEQINVELMKELLEKLGYKILTAQSGKKAIELYREHSKDIKLVILDMIMPEMNGKETLLSLMETDKKVMVLLSSGYSINGEAAKILEMGCKGFIQKPFRVEELSRKIRTVLDTGHS
jgi:two-component system, cell cycle sensor histidine kinase and response regulator CckA